MKLQQLRFLCEVASTMNVTAASAALHTSQSGVSRQIRLLEDELGTPLLAREGKKFLGLTPAGEEIVRNARRLLLDVAQLKEIASSFQPAARLPIRVATSHLHARYTLLKPVEALRRTWSEIRFSLTQVLDDEVAKLVANGTADLGISTYSGPPQDDLVAIPICTLTRGVITPLGHPLTVHKKPRLKDIVEYPLILFDARDSSTSITRRAFFNAKLEPLVVLTAMDADVIKAYVASGLGIAVVPKMTYDSRRDKKLTFIPLDHLIEPTESHLLMRRGQYLRNDMYAFIEAVSPELTRAELDRLGKV